MMVNVDVGSMKLMKDKIMNHIYTPTMHKPIPMGTRVRLVKDSGFPNNLGMGEVVGIASMHVIFNYIVLFDEPFQTEYGTHRAISVMGTLLEKEDGSNFRLNQ